MTYAVNNLLPKTGESCACVSNDEYKRAALLFDKIWSPVAEFVEESILPKQCAFADDKLDREVMRLALLYQKSFKESPQWIDYWRAKMSEHSEEITNERVRDELDASGNLVRLCWNKAVKEIYTKQGIFVTPCFKSELELPIAFSSGENIAWLAALNNLPVVDTVNLEWKQILEFRKDAEAKRKYRDLKLWLKDGLTAQSVEHATQIIEQKIDDYKWALEKHGANSIIGSIKIVLDKESLLTSIGSSIVTAALGGPVWAALIGGSILAAHASTRIAQYNIEHQDIQRGKNREIAFIFEAHKQFSNMA